MSAQVQVVLIAAGCTSAVGLAGMGVIRLLRRASLRLSIQASGAVPVLAIVAGTLGTAEAMFLSQHDLGVVVMVCVIAGVVASAFGWLLGRQVASGSAALRQAARSLGDEAGRFRPPALPLAAEFAALSGTGRHQREAGGIPGEGAGARAVPAAAGGLGLPRPARPAGGAAGDGRGARGRPGRRPAALPQADRAEAERLAAMAGDLFELSRIQSGALRLSPDQIALGDLVSDVLASTEALAREHGVRLDGSATGQLAVRADPRELSRALTNLLANAIRHTPPGGRVHVEASPQNRDVLLAVADGCGGIPQADLPHVFDPAWRGTGARSPAPGAAPASAWPSCTASEKPTTAACAS